MHLGVFNQLLPIWQVFFFIAALLPFLLLGPRQNLPIDTYLFTFYLGFMVPMGRISFFHRSMQPFVLYSLSGLAIAVFLLRLFLPNNPKPQFALSDTANQPTMLQRNGLRQRAAIPWTLRSTLAKFRRTKTARKKLADCSPSISPVD
jgi:hypothetical protein